MLIYERENRGGYLSDETHVNPENIAYAYREITGPNAYRYVAVTIGRSVVNMDEEGYDRIVAWMEAEKLKGDE